MARFVYTKTYFNPPGQITEELYKKIRIQLDINSQLEIDPNPETFTKHFSSSFKTIGICIGLSIICGLIIGDAKEHVLVPVIGISMFIVLITIVYLILEGPSYATYVKAKRDYFDRMKYAIQNTSGYNDFVRVFYGR